MNILNDITGCIGKTPVVKLRHIGAEYGSIYAKVEYMNPGGSVKDRIALNMVIDAEKKGLIKPGYTLVEPTSGNTGIGLAMVAAARGYNLVLTMPDSMSVERRKILKAYGAKIILTPASKGMQGAIDKSKEILEGQADTYMLSQFTNSANYKAHENHTGPEILQALKGVKVDAFIFCVGTGGTLTGIAKAVKKAGLNSKIIAVEPENSAVLSGKSAGKHKIQGIGAGFIPEILDIELIDEIITVSDNEALTTARQLAVCEGLFAGISSGAAVAACLKYLKSSNSVSNNVVTLLPSNGERYLSTDLFENKG